MLSIWSGPKFACVGMGYSTLRLYGTRLPFTTISTFNNPPIESFENIVGTGTKKSHHMSHNENEIFPLHVLSFWTWPNFFHVIKG